MEFQAPVLIDARELPHEHELCFVIRAMLDRISFCQMRGLEPKKRNPS